MNKAANMAAARMTTGGIRRTGLLAIALAGIMLSPACGKTPQEEGSASQKVAAEKGPAMWAVKDADSTIYLFGTFHILPPGTEWSTSAFDKAMAETRITLTEVDTKSTAAQKTMTSLVMELGFNPAGVTLSGTLGAERAARFQEILKRYQLPLQAFEQMKPWLAMISLSVAVMQAEGFSEESGVEGAVLARAASEGDRIAHLESAEYQVRALASLDEREILADFDTSLEDFEKFDVYAASVLGAWKNGDIAKLEAETFADMREKAPKAFQTLITDRNLNWVREIETMMAGDDDYFIAVGAGHLIGEGSVVDLLTEKGYSVERVQ